MTTIVYAKDKNLLVYMDKRHRSAPVLFRYAAFDDAPIQATPFQTADMPDDEQAAAEKVNLYAANLSG